MTKKRISGRRYYLLTPTECRKLIAQADEAMVNTFPHSRIGFSVAVMTTAGTIYTGASYISDTDTLTMHAEATALAHAANHGEKDIVAITGPSCHICKQLIYENSLRSGIDIVSVFKVGRQIKQIPISQMMVYPWPDKAFQQRLDKAKAKKLSRVRF